MRKKTAMASNESNVPTRARRKPCVAFNTSRREVFLDSLSKWGLVTTAATEAGIRRETAYAHRNNDPDFAAAWETALETSLDKLEKEARRRGRVGWLEPVFQGGKRVGKIRKYSDAMLAMLLKAHRPAFKDKSDVNLSGSIGLTCFADIARAAREEQQQLPPPDGSPPEPEPDTFTPA